MQNVYLHKANDLQSFELYQVTKSATPPSGYSRIIDIWQISNLFGAIYDYKTIRDCMRTRVEEIGFDSLTAQQATIAASNNIGTGAQIKSAIPNTAQRDASSYEYLRKMKGINNDAVRPYRSVKLESFFWSRMKHLSVEITTGIYAEAPEFIYSLITISDPNVLGGEISGNLLELYEVAGVQGWAAGDKLLGVYDFIQETAGTRFSPYDPITNPTGGGLRTHPKLSALVPDGFNDMNEFADAALDLIDIGFF